MPTRCAQTNLQRPVFHHYLPYLLLSVQLQVTRPLALLFALSVCCLQHSRYEAIQYIYLFPFPIASLCFLTMRHRRSRGCETWTGKHLSVPAFRVIHPLLSCSSLPLPTGWARPSLGSRCSTIPAWPLGRKCLSLDLRSTCADQSFKIIICRYGIMSRLLRVRLADLRSRLRCYSGSRQEIVSASFSDPRC